MMRFVTASLFVLTVLIGCESSAFAQGAPAAKGGANLPNAFQGFSRDRDDPVRIEANSLEIHDKDRYAVFSGNVVVQQGESIMRSRELKVHYEGSVRESQNQKGATAKPAGESVRSEPAQRIRRLEALGGVVITNKDQKATGDTGVFDMRTNTATIIGNVVISQGPNVMRGDKLVVDLKTGYSRLEAGSKGGGSRVQGLFVPSTTDTKKPGSAK